MSRFSDIRQWAEDRNLIAGSTAEKQFVKLMEEFGEVAAGIARGNGAAILDGIGDCIVVLTIITAQLGGDIGEALAREGVADVDAPPHWVGRDACFQTVAQTLAKIELRPDSRMTAYQGLQIRNAVLRLRDLAHRHGLRLSDCIEHAWSEIKDRRGRMVDGVFIKEADLGEVAP